ncbi:MAG: hypothetical protein ACON5D_14345 [Rubripirellula sp.]
MFADYPNKRLCDVVFPGAHDASITAGNSHVMTQAKDIYEQAKSGCRWFDTRVMVAAAKNQTVQAVGYHSPAKWAPPLTKNKGKHNEHQKLLVGGKGEALRDICSEARRFVEEYKTEFIFLKFDKCLGGYENIVIEVARVLGSSGLYYPGDLNTALLSELKGKVIPLYPEKERKNIGHHKLGYTPQMAAALATGDGTGPLPINFWKNLHGKPHYDHDYKGLQYIGKYSASTFAPWRILQRTTKLNWYSKTKVEYAKKVQKEERLPLAKKAVKKGSLPVHTLGMMYWTATGWIDNIEKRDLLLWTKSGVNDLEKIWRGGLQLSIEEKMEQCSYPQDSTGPVGLSPKCFLPNIVMIDFVNDMRCNTIWGLNKQAESHMQYLMNLQNFGD